MEHKFKRLKKLSTLEDASIPANPDAAPRTPSKHVSSPFKPTMNSFNFYGSLADAVLNPSNQKQTRLFPTPGSHSKKRTYEDFKAKETKENIEPPKKRLKKNADSPVRQNLF